jgi:hypothetical protein
VIDPADHDVRVRGIGYDLEREPHAGVLPPVERIAGKLRHPGQIARNPAFHDVEPDGLAPSVGPAPHDRVGADDERVQVGAGGLAGETLAGGQPHQPIADLATGSAGGTLSTDNLFPGSRMHSPGLGRAGALHHPADPLFGELHVADPVHQDQQGESQGDEWEEGTAHGSSEYGQGTGQVASAVAPGTAPA